MNYSLAEQAFFELTGRWPQSVVDRRLSTTTWDPSSVNAIFREMYEGSDVPLPAKYLDDRPRRV